MPASGPGVRHLRRKGWLPVAGTIVLVIAECLLFVYVVTVDWSFRALMRREGFARSVISHRAGVGRPELAFRGNRIHSRKRPGEPLKVREHRFTLRVQLISLAPNGF
jgi:hypothetical protein